MSLQRTTEVLRRAERRAFSLSTIMTPEIMTPRQTRTEIPHTALTDHRTSHPRGSGLTQWRRCSRAAGGFGTKKGKEFQRRRHIGLRLWSRRLWQCLCMNRGQLATTTDCHWALPLPQTKGECDVSRWTVLVSITLNASATRATAIVLCRSQNNA